MFKEPQQAVAGLVRRVAEGGEDEMGSGPRQPFGVAVRMGRHRDAPSVAGMGEGREDRQVLLERRHGADHERCALEGQVLELFRVSRPTVYRTLLRQAAAK